MQTNKKTSMNILYHKIIEGKNQSKVFIIDCIKSKMNQKELLDRLNVVYQSKYLKDYKKTIILKKGNKIIGIYKEKKT